MRLKGIVGKKPFGGGSKSEHIAVYLAAEGGREYVLRRVGGNAFSDPTLESIVGRRIECEGTVTEYTFVMTDFHVID